MINMSNCLEKVIGREDLSASEMREVMHYFMSGQASDSQMAGFLCALRSKGETVEEMTAAAEVLRELASPMPMADTHLIDTCGTGGDGAHTFNISTTSAFVVAAAGGRVAKHGNRSVSSLCGSADVLELAGVNLNLSAQQVVQCIQTLGIGFLFAPRYHSAMQHTRQVRRTLGVRTLFNLLGPLCNPAGAKHQLIGVYDQKWVVPLAQVFKQLGSRHVLVVNAHDGLDEITLTGVTHVAELKDQSIVTYQITPEQFGITATSLASIAINTPQESLALLQAVLANQACAAKDIVVLNAGAAIYAADLVDTLADGMMKAQAVISDGSAYQKFHDFVAYTQQFTS